MKRFLKICIYSSVAFFMIAQKGIAKSGHDLAVEKGCVTCHQLDGISKNEKVPNLAGQKLKYMRKQLDLFVSERRMDREGVTLAQRYHPVMENEAIELTKLEAYLILSYYSKLQCTIPAKKIYDMPVMSAQRCEICHGGLASSPFRDTPHLAGQKLTYLRAQMDKMIKSLNMLSEKEKALAVTSLTDQEKKGKAPENVRYHRLSALFVEGLSPEEIDAALVYYSNLGCE